MATFRGIIILVIIGRIAADTCKSRFGGSCVNMYYNRCLSGDNYVQYGCGFQEICCYPPTPVPAPAVLQGQCGVSTPVQRHSTKIVGGTQAAPGEFPWQVSMRSQGQHVCGGILIGDQWVLTAAHCFRENKNPFAWTVVLGENDRAVLEGFEQLVKVETLFVHASFDPVQFVNDIALVKLGTKVQLYSQYVRPVCKPNVNESFSDMICTITGWGAAYSGGHGTRGLYKADVPILSNEVCSYLMDRSIPKTEVCAGRKHGGVDTCQGDSGGPMVCLKNGVWNIVGIVSWGYSCAEAYTPGVYTRVQSYIDWIDHVTSMYGDYTPPAVG